MKNKIKLYTPSVSSFYENVGYLEDIELKESRLDTKLDEVVLFTGSILDRSEIDYREVTKSKGVYYTILSNNIQYSAVDEYWFKHTTVIYKSEFISNFLTNK